MKNIFIIGAGSRTLELLINPLHTEAERYPTSKIVGIFDINICRAKLVSSLSPYQIPVYTNLCEVVEIDDIDLFIITTRDDTHSPIIQTLLAHPKAVIFCEKPLCISLEQAHCLDILPPEAKSRIFLLLNSRFMPINTAIKKLLSENVIGKPLSITYNWNIDVNHGSEYLRRWHSNIELSGGMLVHKSCHHFDLLNWWLEDTPNLVSAFGNKLFYTTPTSFGNNCRTCLTPCKYKIDLQKQPMLEEMYFNAEHYDDYIRDKCIFKDVTVNDTMHVQLAYHSGTLASYSLNLYSPTNSWQLRISGTKGNIDCCYAHNRDANSLIVTEHSGITRIENIAYCELKHCGADLSLRKIIYSEYPADLSSTLHIGTFQEGFNASVIGILSERSIQERRCYVNQ